MTVFEPTKSSIFFQSRSNLDNQIDIKRLSPGTRIAFDTIWRKERKMKKKTTINSNRNPCGTNFQSSRKIYRYDRVHVRWNRIRKTNRSPIQQPLLQRWSNHTESLSNTKASTRSKQLLNTLGTTRTLETNRRNSITKHRKESRWTLLIHGTPAPSRTVN